MKQVQYSLPDNWAWKTLDDVSEKITDGTHHSPKVQHSEWKPGRFKYITSKNIKNYGMKLDDISFIDQNVHDEIYARCAPELEDQLLTKDGAMTGTCCLNELNEPFSLLSSVALIKQKRSMILPKYLNYFLQSHVGQNFLLGDISGAAITRTNIKKIKSTPVPLAPFLEQKSIVEKLDALLIRIDTAMEHLQESATQADALFESSQSEIFNDVLSKHQNGVIDDICTVTSSKRIFKADYVESGIPFYRTKEIVDLSKEQDISTELYIDKEKYSEISDKFGAPKKGDLLFSAVGTIGVMWIVDDREFYFKDGNLLWLKDMKGVTPEYLRAAITAVLTEKIKDRSQGAAYKAISITNLKAFEIPLPNIEEQKLIVAKIETVSSLTKKTKQEMGQQIRALQNLKASILDSAFKGEL